MEYYYLGHQTPGEEARRMKGDVALSEERIMHADAGVFHS